ncbi:hypothetical protein ACIA5D_05045 [Actinoplanes sp. NPDC051513]|uniref:hypothetical protein n=1 Tax=Actinoplanes sp. NPDC051513 TaxID=3363908 RepID=UPI00379A4BD1
MRRRRPSRGTLLRLAAVAALLATAAFASWSASRSCTGKPGAAADPSQGSPTAAAPASAAAAPAGSGSASSRAANSGSTNTGAANAGAAGSGSTNAGAAGSGSTNAGAAGSAGSGSTNAGAAGSGSTNAGAAGSAGSGAAGSAGSGAAGSAGSGADGPAHAGQVTVPPGSLGVPIRLADPTALSLVRPGNRVDLLRMNRDGGPTAVAAAALVLKVTGAGDPTAGGGLLLALAPTEAQRAVVTPGHGFAILIRPG